MNSIQPKLKHKIPKIRNFWLRFAKYLVGAIILSYFLYFMMSQMDTAYLKDANNKRSTLFLIMLNIMSAEYWGWFWFLTMMFSALWGDWHNFRWQSFSEEKLDELEEA